MGKTLIMGIGLLLVAAIASYKHFGLGDPEKPGCAFSALKTISSDNFDDLQHGTKLRYRNPVE